MRGAPLHGATTDFLCMRIPSSGRFRKAKAASSDPHYSSCWNTVIRVMAAASCAGPSAVIAMDTDTIGTLSNATHWVPSVLLSPFQHLFTLCLQS